MSWSPRASTGCHAIRSTWLGFYKQLSYYDVAVVTIGEGEISELHVGLKGAMSALYLKDLAQKTKRGLEGRVRQGRSAGGVSYGYRIARRIGPDGSPTTGEREIDETEADVVRSIFAAFAAGARPRAIAKGPQRPGRHRSARRGLGRVHHLRQLATRDEWVVEQVPELRIISDELWASVKERQAATRHVIVEDREVRPERARRPRYLFSGL